MDISRAETLALIRFYAGLIKAIADKGTQGDTDDLVEYVRRLGELAVRPEITKRG
jgi:hypothetical protein